MLMSIRPLAKCAPEELRGNAERRVRYRLVRMRRAAGLTQEKLARALQCDRTSVENWERGTSRVPAWALDVVAELAARKAVGT